MDLRMTPRRSEGRSDEAPLRRGGGMKYASQALPRRRLLWPALALGVLLLAGCARDGAQEHYERGKALYNQGKFAEAEKEYREAIRLKPNFVVAHYNLGLALKWSGGGPYEAIKEYREAIRLKPDYAEAHYELAAVLYGFGESEEAIKELREYVRLKPDDAEAHRSLGNVLWWRGTIEEVTKEYREVVRLKPDDAEALWDLAIALDHQDKRKEARIYWERAEKVEKRPEELEKIKKRLAEPR